MATSRLMISALFLIAAIGSARAQITPYQASTEKLKIEQKKSAEDWDAKYRKEWEASMAFKKKLAECKRQAKAQKFKLHVIKRSRFINQCVTA